MDVPVGILLTHWKSYVTNISRNLMELSEQDDVKLILLKVKDTANGYTGLTRVKAAKAAEDLDRLWRYYSLLSDVVDKAGILYSKDSFLNDTERAARRLLEETPVILEKEHIDINNRSLLSSENTEIKMTLKELLSYMQQSFEDVRKTLSGISHAAETMENRLASMKNEIHDLNNTALRLGIKDIPLFDLTKATKAESDPLQGLAELDELSLSLEKYKTSIRAIEQDYNKTSESLDRSWAMLCEMEEITQKWHKAAAESQSIFGTAYDLKPVIDKDVLKSLNDWLDVLKDKLSQGFINAAEIGAQKLEQECALKLENERESYSSCCRDYNEWLDLKGEFKALLVKLKNLKDNGRLFDNSMDVLIENIRTALYSDKVNLESCRQLIDKFRLSLKS